MRLGISFDADRFKWSVGIRTYGFSWLPGEEESGSSYPAQFLDVPYGDKYWVWSWLCFVVFYVKGGR